MKKDPLVFLAHILDSITQIEQYAKGVSKEKFIASRQVQDAIIRNLEIIGEAVKNLPEEFRKKSRSVPWEEIAGTRDILIHQYFGVDLDLVWSVLKKDLPTLKRSIKKLMVRQ